MPPMITDDDASSASSRAEDIMPPKRFTKPTAKPAAKPASKRGRSAKSAKPVEEPVEDLEDDVVADPEAGNDEDEDEDEDEDDEETPEDVYAVEKILGHSFEKDGTLKYHIKWVGYESPKDRTWEPGENLSGASARLNEYHTKIGGKPIFKPATPAAKPRGRGKRKSQPAEPSPDVESSTKPKRRKTNGTTESAKDSNGAIVDHGLPTGSWEDDVEIIQTIEEKEVKGKNGKPTRELFIFLEWKDGRQFEHSANVVRQKCPQKLLDYLLSKLVFKTNENDPAQDEEEDTAGAAADVI